MTTDLALARGLVDGDGARHRRARLRPPTGQAELELAARSPDAPLAHDEADELLAGCVERIGGFTDPSAVVVALSRGDRARVALAARAMLVGDGILLVVQCPAAGCSALADLSLRTSALLGDTRRPQPLEVSVETADGELVVRPPTGYDERAAAGSDDTLWGRLVSRDGAPVGDDGWRNLDPESTHRVALALSDLDPCADLAVVTACPQCGAWIELEVDPLDLLMRTPATGERRLLAEVHCLAFSYGWSEAEILALPRTRRLAYLELLDDELGGRPLTSTAGA